jgi:replication factor C subunit 1
MTEMVETEPKVVSAKPAKPNKGSSSKAHEDDLEIKHVKAAPHTKTAGSKGKSSGGSSSVHDILASIPDAILPEVEEGKKFNFHAHQAKLSQVPQNNVAEIPQAANNCLAGLTFVFTGTMPGLSREQGQDLVKRYGGKCTGAVSRNTSCVVLGAEAGPKKIETINKLGVKAIDQDGFLQLLAHMPADGGSSEAALKAMEKKKIQEKKVEQVAREMAQEMAKKPKPRQQGAAKVDSIKKQPQSLIDPSEKLWTSRYAPTNLSHICGNKGAVDKLHHWLVNWRSNINTPGAMRAAILHGPPGIGKTTAAHLVAKLLDYDVLESNASDTRSKTLLQNTVGKTLSNTSLAGYMHKAGEQPTLSKRRVCIIMDEVDGMSAGDRGGVGAMAVLCRTTNVPIILICNERSLPKMRPFDRVTLDIPFRRPDVSAIKPRIMSIAYNEGLQLDPGVIDQLVQSTRSDIRQIINLMSTYATTNKNMDFDSGKHLTKSSEKHIVLKPFDIVGKYLTGATFAPSNRISLNEKIELYFHDHDFAPLMVQENYLSTAPSRVSSTGGGHLELVSRAAESISDGDLVDKKIHGSQQQWSLMPLHGALTCVRPSFFVAGQIRGRTNFTSYLGNNSKAGKYWRLLAELQSHARLKLWGDKLELRLQYLPLLTYKLLNPLLQDGADGVGQVMQVMDNYYLTKEDWDVIMELGVGPDSPEPKAKGLPTAVKSAFTRKYNSAEHPVPYMKSVGAMAAEAKGQPKADKPDLEDVIEDDVEVPEEESQDKGEQDDITKDKYINIAKPKGKAAAAKGKAAAKPAVTKAKPAAAKAKAKPRAKK